MSESIESIKAEILRLHRLWIDANAGLQGHLLGEVMAGPKFFNYNLNGYRYNGLAEIQKLWQPEHMGSAFELRVIRNERNLQIEATAEMGWVTAEADVELRMKLAQGSGEMRGDGEIVVMPFRITELFRRDDGSGKPVWRMWHFHCSQELADGGKRFITE